ncbi:hypothetical protein ACFQS6_05470 [Xanthomonas populi]
MQWDEVRAMRHGDCNCMKRQGGDAMTVALQGGAARRKTRTLGEALDHAWWATLEEFYFCNDGSQGLMRINI